jgi:hypothetical protein
MDCPNESGYRSPFQKVDIVNGWDILIALSSVIISNNADRLCLLRSVMAIVKVEYLYV